MNADVDSREELIVKREILVKSEHRNVSDPVEIVCLPANENSQIREQLSVTTSEIRAVVGVSRHHIEKKSTRSQRRQSQNVFGFVSTINENDMNENNVIKNLEDKIITLNGEKDRLLAQGLSVKAENQKISHNLKKKEDTIVRMRKHNELLKAQMSEIRDRIPPGPPENQDIDEKYVVERILKHKLANQTRWFLIRWEGYGPGDDTWEPEANLTKLIVFKNYVDRHFK